MPQTETKPTTSPDRWVRASTLISAVTPILVLLVGYVLNQKVNEANLSIARQKVAFEELKAKAEELKLKVDAESVATKSQIDKVDAVLKLLQDLTGANPERRRVAMEAVKIVLPPKEAINILTALNNSAEPGSKQSVEVKSVLNAERQRLVEGMFSYDQEARTLSLRTLQQAWSTDEVVIRLLLARGRSVLDERKKSGFRQKPPSDSPDFQQKAIVYNIAAFLAVVSPSDAELKKEIAEFGAAAEKNSPDTATMSRRIKEKFQP